MTIKHKNAILATKINLLATEKSQKSQKSQEKSYICNCGKNYKDKSGLWRHHKQCQYINKDDTNNIIHYNTEQLKLFTEVVKNTVIEVMKHGPTTNNTINNISNNKTFNLNLYLNETCKDAITPTEKKNETKTY
jgi:hypothetical protein